MGLAPTPGASKRKRQGVRITIDNDTRDLHLADLGPQDDAISRKETGMPVTSFIDEDTFALDSVAVLWWMACRKNGQPRLKFRDVLKDFPSYSELADLADADRFSIDSLEEVDDEEEESHPLPSAADS